MIYQAKYRAISPVHIGYRMIGFLNTTRYYITGKVMWGAMTAQLTRRLFEEPTSNDYRNTGEFIKKHIRTTYFFPYVSDVLYLPVYTEEGLKYDDLIRSDFEKKFVHSRVSTALDKTGSAEDESLHEVEYIRNKVEINENVENVYWVGYIFVDKNEENKGIEVVTSGDQFTVVAEGTKVEALGFLGRISVGGERNYGFGKLELRKENLQKTTAEIFDCAVEGNKVESLIALGHVEYYDTNYIGEIEPLVGRDWGERGVGRSNKKIDSNICFVPGTRFAEKTQFEIAEFGILRKI